MENLVCSSILIPAQVLELNNNQRDTWDRIMAEPTIANLSWKKADNLFRALGATVKYTDGSSVRVYFGSLVGYFHIPHGSEDLPKRTVRRIRELLLKAIT